MPPLKEGQVYAIDGGLFQAVYNEAEERFQLWTHEGHSGRVIARTGFEIDADGQLYHRIFDFETREQFLLASEAYTVDDLEAIDETQLP